MYSLSADYTTLAFHNGRLYLCYQHFFGNSSTKKSNLQFFACEDVYQTVKSKHPPNNDGRNRTYIASLRSTFELHRYFTVNLSLRFQSSYAIN